MLTVSLTSIPPRFDGLGPCLESLLAQRGVGRVVLTIPHKYTRFPDSFTLPALPAGVTLLRCNDTGPACKILPLAAQSEASQPILYCDDDWDYEQGWAAGFLGAHADHPEAAIAASTFSSERLGSQGVGLIAQGFAGVLLTPNMLPRVSYDVPVDFQLVDDIWLSGMLALGSSAIVPASHLRQLAKPSANEASPLQNEAQRAKANHACVAFLSAQFGVWPPKTER